MAASPKVLWVELLCPDLSSSSPSQVTVRVKVEAPGLEESPPPPPGGSWDATPRSPEVPTPAPPRPGSRPEPMRIPKEEPPTPPDTGMRHRPLPRGIVGDSAAGECGKGQRVTGAGGCG